MKSIKTYTKNSKKHNKKQNIFIGLAWPYVNGDLHIGHLAGYLLPGDFCARFHRLKGNKVLMVSGADCHGTPATLEADKLKIKPQDVVAKYFKEHQRLIKNADLSFDIYTKTTTENHKKTVQEFFLKFLNQGYIFKKTTKQFYSPQENKFLADRYVKGTCPYCGFQNTRSDQCENCNKLINPEELINPYSRVSQQPLILKETEHYFMDWKKLEPFLKKYFESHKKLWRPWIQNETQKWLEKGLEPTPITRDLDWGIELPIAKIPKSLRLENIQNKRIYVWFEAVIGYFSASKEWAKKYKKNYKDFWYSKNAKHYYFMGKDNLVFHTLFWPAELYLYDKKIHLPDVLAINQFLNLEGNKFSKSHGYTVDSSYILEKYGSDQVRFYLASIMPEESDANFSWTDFQSRTNDVLIANFGNFINRVLNLAEDVKIPKHVHLDKEILQYSTKIYQKIIQSLDNVQLKNYFNELVDFSSWANKYISNQKPWSLKNTNRDQFDEIMLNCLYLVLCLDLLAKPILTQGTDKIDKMLGIKIKAWPEVNKFNTFLTSLLCQIKIKNISPLYQKIENEQIKLEEEKLIQQRI